MSIGEFLLLVGAIGIAGLNLTYIPIVIFSGVLIVLEAAALRWMPLVPVTTTQERRKDRIAYLLLALVVIAMVVAVVSQLMK